MHSCTLRCLERSASTVMVGRLHPVGHQVFLLVTRIPVQRQASAPVVVQPPWCSLVFILHLGGDGRLLLQPPLQVGRG